MKDCFIGKRTGNKCHLKQRFSTGGPQNVPR